MYAREDIFAIAVRENLRLMAAYPLQLIVIISGHAATNQMETLQRLAAEFNAAHDKQVLVALPFVSNAEGILEVGHASRIETSIMLALQPETVKLENLPPAAKPLHNPDWGIIDYFTFAGQPTADRVIHQVDDPRQATAAAGEEMLRRATKQILDRVEETLTQMESN
jgi:creatinine amidohydrolase/Fe(II)-dependent formamide hydrolase-like protein